MARTITSANAVLLLAVAGLFDTPVRIQGFAADDAFAADAKAVVQSEMGVDGALAHGFTNAATKLKITLQANSESLDFFHAWYEKQLSDQEAYPCDGSIDLKGPGKTWTLTNGGLTTYKPVYDAKKVLQKVEMEITFESSEVADI